jgi:tripartite-type tricarboxylate transporter receptor subunit TctC
LAAKIGAMLHGSVLTGRFVMQAFVIARCVKALACLGAVLVLWAHAAAAQPEYPQKPIRIIVPFGPGGSSDVVARLLQVPLQQALGQSIVVEHRPGAGSNIGTAAVARAEPDGYTLLITSSAFVLNPSLYAKPPYDPFKDFAPIADLADAPNVLTASRQSGLGTLGDALERARREPGKLNGATPGIGTTPHLSFEHLKARAALEVVLVPYSGGGPGAQAVLAGTTELFFGALPNSRAHIEAKMVTALAVASSRRWPDLPDVPTFVESGFPGFVMDTGHLFLAPAGTPREIVAKLGRAAVDILQRVEIRQRLLELGYFAVGGGPEAAQARIARDVPFYRDIVTTAKLRIE